MNVFFIKEIFLFHSFDHSYPKMRSKLLILCNETTGKALVQADQPSDTDNVLTNARNRKLQNLPQNFCRKHDFEHRSNTLIH